MKASTGFEGPVGTVCGRDRRLARLGTTRSCARCRLYSAAAKVKGSASSRVAATGLIGAELAHNWYSTAPLSLIYFGGLGSTSQVLPEPIRVAIQLASR